MKRHVGETELYELERYCSNVTKVCLEPVLRLIKEVRERREHEAKYRWHDLRKNPDDLPEKDGNDESEYVLVMIGQPNWNHWEQAYYNHAKGMWSTYEQNVFAWKYIEPFEVSE